MDKRVWGMIVAATTCVACASEPSGAGLDAGVTVPPGVDGGMTFGDGGGADAWLPDGSVGPDAAMRRDGGAGRAGAGACVDSADCDDGIACTDDFCRPIDCFPTPGACGSRCAHEIDLAACGPTETCNLLLGCVPGRACATRSDCTDDDPCTVNEYCDAERRVCVSSVLDGDRDGEPAPICGGVDCDDAAPSTFPGAREACDRGDDDCDGVVDEGASATCGSGLHCGEAGCECDVAGLEICFADIGGPLECLDLQNDVDHCGYCYRSCSDGSGCVAGECRCPDPTHVDCGGFTGCVDTSSDDRNCGACLRSCSATQRCVAGACTACGGIGQPCCTSGSCRIENSECVDGTCELRACADPITPLPSSVLPRCSAATYSCLFACFDDACATACYDADTTPAVDDVDCRICTGLQRIACANAAGCDDEWAAYACCYEDHCTTGSCPACTTELNAWSVCASSADCYVNTSIVRQCFP